MKQLIITSTTKDNLIKEIGEMIDEKISKINGKKDTRISRLDLANGNWSGGFKMTPPTQDKFRRNGQLKPIQVGGKIFYRESDLLNLGIKDEKG